MTKLKIKLIAGAVGVGFVSTMHILLHLKFYPGWYALAIVGYFTVRKSVKRIQKRRKNERKNDTCK